MHCNTSPNSLRLAFVALALALAVGASGCGTRHCAVTGTVKYNGAPLAKPEGQIIFVGSDGSQVAAPIGLDGTYTASKVTPGLKRVAVYYRNPAFTKPSPPK